METQRISLEWNSDCEQQQQAKQHLARSEYRGIEMFSVPLHQHVRVRSEHRAQNQRHATCKRLFTRHGELIRKHNAHTKHTQNDAANLRPVQTLSREMYVCEDQSERGERRL